MRKLSRKRNSSFECGNGVKNGEETENRVAHCRRLRIAPEGLRGWDRRLEITSKQAEAVALLVRGHGYRVSEVATCLRRDQAHVSTMLSRLSAFPHSFAEDLFKIIASFDFLRALSTSALKIVADPSQPNNLGLIRPLADFGGSAVQSPSPSSPQVGIALARSARPEPDDRLRSRDFLLRSLYPLRSIAYLRTTRLNRMRRGRRTSCLSAMNMVTS